GPAGPQGPEGPEGPGVTELVYIGSAAGPGPGQAVYGLDLPPEVGSDPNNPPSIACYAESRTPAPFWIQVGGWSDAGTAPGDPICVLQLRATGVWFVGVYFL